MNTQIAPQVIETSTPWGRPHGHRVIAPGIVSYSTGSHGGVHLSAERIAQMPEALSGITTFAEPGWYEEDVDVNLVIVAFPEFFNPFIIWCACNSIATYPPHAGAAFYLQSPEGAHVQAIADRFQKEQAHLYRTSSMLTSGKGWTVDFVRISDHHRVRVAGLTTHEAHEPGPIDITRYADRIVHEA